MAESAADRVAEILEPAHFYLDKHATIFRAIVGMRQKGDPVDVVVLSAELERLGALAAVGGRSRLVELQANVTAVSNVGHHAGLVLEAARSRTVYRAALAVQKAASNGGLALHPELIDEMQGALDDARVLPGEPGLPRGPIFITAHDFAAREFAPPEPLLGTDDIPILAVGSLNLFAGRPGSGKTTTLLDMCCHLAAGVPWPPTDGTDKAPAPWPCPKPLRIALIENEGPQESFKRKLKDKLERFPHSIVDSGGKLVVHSLNWGAFSFADRGFMAQVADELDSHEIDLVVGDPLASLGLEGVGSPAETLAFVQLLRPLGLGAHRAFLFLHHFRERVEKHEDELSKLSGAWGGHLDTLLSLAATHSEDQLRLAYPKVRWARSRAPHPIILGKVYNVMGVEALAEEGDTTLLEPQVYQALAEARQAGIRNGWMDIDEIRSKLQARTTDVRKALQGSTLFASVTGDQAVAMGAKSKRKIFWGLREWSDAEPPLDAEPEPQENPEQTRLAADDGEGDYF